MLNYIACIKVYTYIHVFFSCPFNNYLVHGDKCTYPTVSPFLWLEPTLNGGYSRLQPVNNEIHINLKVNKLPHFPWLNKFVLYNMLDKHFFKDTNTWQHLKVFVPTVTALTCHHRRSRARVSADVRSSSGNTSEPPSRPETALVAYLVLSKYRESRQYIEIQRIIYDRCHKSTVFFILNKLWKLCIIFT